MKTIRVRRIRLFSAGKMSAFVGALLGLLAGIPVSLLAFASARGSTVLAGSGVEDSLSTASGLGVPAIFLGVGAIVIFPLLYGFVAFVSGVIHALVYNFVAGFVGGLVLETD